MCWQTHQLGMEAQLTKCTSWQCSPQWILLSHLPAGNFSSLLMCRVRRKPWETPTLKAWILPISHRCKHENQLSAVIRVWDRLCLPPLRIHPLCINPYVLHLLLTRCPFKSPMPIWWIPRWDCSVMVWLLTGWRITALLSREAELFYVLGSDAQEIQFSHTVINTCYFLCGCFFPPL